MFQRDNTDSVLQGCPVIPPNIWFPFLLRGRRRRSVSVLSQRACTERPNPPHVEEETPLPSSDAGEGAQRHYLFEESRIKYLVNMRVILVIT
jgi:hypothetical protein